MGQDEALDESQTRRDATKPKRRRHRDKELDERKTVLHEASWEDFVLLSKVCLLRDSEATIYDVFDTWRTKLLGGWEFSPEFVARIDAEIEEEYGDKETL